MHPVLLEGPKARACAEAPAAVAGIAACQCESNEGSHTVSDSLLAMRPYHICATERIPQEMSPCV